MRRSRVAQRLNVEESFSEVGNTGGAFPFAKIHSKGERPTRSAVRTSSPLRSLRPCPRNGLQVSHEPPDPSEDPPSIGAPERFDRIEASGLVSRVQSEEQADHE